MVEEQETDKFLREKHRQNQSNNCFLKWWNQEFLHQEYLCRIIESWTFRFLIIFLVVIDTALIISEIMLDSFKIHYECKHKSHQLTKHEEPNKIKHIETAMEIAHFMSISILVFFVIELIVRMYASGNEFWNIRRKKMEYFDAFIVITSLIIDLYYLRIEEKLVGSELLFIFSFRLWRFVRIITSVAEGILDDQEKHKGNLNKQYLIALNRLVEILKYKTNHLENSENNIQTVLEHFQNIDQQCQSSLNELNENRTLTSSNIVAQFIDDINGVENRTNHNVAESIIPKPTTLNV